ncbi:KpsF/GutQ family sugar-phosphate isomerase [Helicobacter pylori]|uniref:KpsF/GutQ family sugar-phosphate isomerase n=1 Tax=Helicobacter pylori TaxID=210 RepID=UPI000FDD6D23|nr:KpsF/GutQ family sugar-phosphate isomerase [Helicobacter pylori]RVZ67501.1 KpsF/GutQ family sugar-phosphate isomerase [Helicobacter pylori]
MPMLFDCNATAIQVLKDEASALLESVKQFQEPNDLEAIVKLILKSQEKGGKLVIVGVGKSALVAQKIAASMLSTGNRSAFLHPTEAMHGDLGMVEKNDVILMISYGGESLELLNLVSHLKRLSHKIITFTKSSNSSLSKLGDYYLSLKIKKEACPINTAPTTSTTLTLALGDVLMACLMRAKNFSQEDFASFHPGGLLGKKLFVKVKDLLQTTNLPLILPSTSFKDALIEMSEKRLGSAILVNEANELVGVLSDGDVRRALLKGVSLESEVRHFATLKPKSFKNLDALLLEALEFLEHHKIQLLVCVDDCNKVLGVLHLHQLLELGLKA